MTPLPQPGSGPVLSSALEPVLAAEDDPDDDEDSAGAVVSVLVAGGPPQKPCSQRWPWPHSD